MNRLMPEKQKARKLWRPKLPELSDQCASCPFRTDNKVEFTDVVQGLRRKMGMIGTPSTFDVFVARTKIARECKDRGDFACHHTVYDSAMNIKPVSEYRQCYGATKYFKGEDPCQKRTPAIKSSKSSKTRRKRITQ